MNLKKGDKVVRIPGRESGRLTKPYYIVSTINGNRLVVEGVSGGRDVDRFKLFVEKTSLNQSEFDWTYGVQSLQAINWEAMLSELTPQKPLQLIEITSEKTGIKTQMVGVHHTLLSKAHFLNVDLPGAPVDGYLNLFGCENHFGEWVTWAKEVKAACWGKDSIKGSVHIKLITV